MKYNYASQIYAQLTDFEKRRTSIMNVFDTLEAIARDMERTQLLPIIIEQQQPVESDSVVAVVDQHVINDVDDKDDDDYDDMQREVRKLCY